MSAARNCRLWAPARRLSRSASWPVSIVKLSQPGSQLADAMVCPGLFLSQSHCVSQALIHFHSSQSLVTARIPRARVTLALLVIRLTSSSASASARSCVESDRLPQPGAPRLGRAPQQCRVVACTGLRHVRRAVTPWHHQSLLEFGADAGTGLHPTPSAVERQEVRDQVNVPAPVPVHVLMRVRRTGSSM